MIMEQYTKLGGKSQVKNDNESNYSFGDIRAFSFRIQTSFQESRKRGNSQKNEGSEKQEAGSLRSSK